MYLRHFGLKTKPFAMNPDPTFLYASEQHSAAFTMLEYAIVSQASFCLLTGEIGSGKTTLIRHLIRMLGDQVTVGLVSNAHQRFKSIHPWALSALGICPDGDSEIAQYEALTDFVIREYGQGRRTLLIFDEAQNLSIGTLEELRLLSNINSESDVALQTLLVGQPELRAKMARPELEQFAQRIAVDFHLQSLSLEEARAYVGHRLKIAGGAEDIFDRKAVKLIHQKSAGIPRLINRLCDLALVYAFAEQRDRVGAAVVSRVLKDRNSGRARPVFAPSAALLAEDSADAPESSDESGPALASTGAADEPRIAGRI
jgi:type II secretory pathway predicted ATPase ExeA